MSAAWDDDYDDDADNNVIVMIITLHAQLEKQFEIKCNNIFIAVWTESFLRKFWS